MSDIINVKARVSKELFYNTDTMYGVYSFYLIDSDKDVKINKDWNNFVVTGNCPQLLGNKEYEFSMIPTKHKKYGDGYGFVEVSERKLGTIEDQQQYLRQVISKRDANILIEAYPNTMIVDEIKHNKIDVSKLKGIKEAKLLKIKEKLSMYDNLKLVLVELSDLDISMNALKRLVNHFGTQDALIKNIKENIYCLTAVDMFGFIKVDEYAMKRGDDPTSPNRIKACFEYIIKDEGKDGHSWVPVDTLIQKAENLLKIDTVIIVNELESIKSESKEFYFKDDKFTLKRFFDYEKNIKFHLDRLYSNYQTTKRQINFDEIEEKLNIAYTEEQKEVIRMADQNGVMIINGKGGTGKTTVLKGIIETLSDEVYNACALSGKAANVLSSKGIKSSTIHRMLGVTKNGQFMYNEENQLPYDIVIVDEASMINTYLFNCILKAIPDGGKIIIVGDAGQLPAIGLGSVFEDLLQTQTYPNKELTIVHRQAQKSGILTSANKIRDGEKINGRYEHNPQTYGVNKDMVLYPMKSREKIFDTIMTIARSMLKKHGREWIDDFQIITAVKQRGENSVKKLNIELQKIFNDTSKDSLERNGYSYLENDKVIHNGNNYNAITFPDVETYIKYKDYSVEDLIEEDDVKLVNVSVFNGTVGTIVHIDKHEKNALIKFEDIDGLVIYSQQDLNMIELGYAITVHRSQGMGIKNVLFTLDYVAYKLLSKQLVYTALTRASEKLVVVCENGALHQAIETDLSSTRRTFLKDLIKVK